MRLLEHLRLVLVLLHGSHIVLLHCIGWETPGIGVPWVGTLTCTLETKIVVAWATREYFISASVAYVALHNLKLLRFGILLQRVLAIRAQKGRCLVCGHAHNGLVCHRHGTAKRSWVAPKADDRLAHERLVLTWVHPCDCCARHGNLGRVNDSSVGHYNAVSIWERYTCTRILKLILRVLLGPHAIVLPHTVHTLVCRASLTASHISFYSF